MSQTRWKIDGVHSAVEFEEMQLETGAAYPGEKVKLKLNMELLAES